MDSALKDSMFRYYDERAPEYDAFYLQGVAPGTTIDPSQYRVEVQTLLDLVGRHCAGAILDVPCGTGFWMSAYGKRASTVTLIDQSSRMLAESRRKSHAHGIEPRCTFRQEDVLACQWADQQFDTILTGFF